MSIFAYEIAKIWIDMELYNVQLRTDLDEVVVLQVYANDSLEAEFTAKSMVECGQAGTISNVVVEYYVTL